MILEKPENRMKFIFFISIFQGTAAFSPISKRMKKFCSIVRKVFQKAILHLINNFKCALKKNRAIKECIQLWQVPYGCSTNKGGKLKILTVY